MPSPPDLSTPEARAAYQGELAAIARPWRWIGLTLVAVGVALLATVDMAPVTLIAIVLIVLGWAQVIAGIVLRFVYHRRRMRGE